MKKPGLAWPSWIISAALADQLLRGPFPDAHRHDRLGGLQLVCHFKADVGQLIGRVLAVGRLTAYHQNLPHRIAGEGGGVPAVSYLKDLAGLQVEALEHLHGLILGDVLLVDDVLLVVWPHVLVEAAEAAGRRAHFDVEVDVGEPHHLQGLHGRSGRILRDHTAVLRNGQKFLLPLFDRCTSAAWRSASSAMRWA